MWQPCPGGNYSNGDGSRQVAEPTEIWKTRRYISEHLDEKISLTEVARLVKRNPTYLSQRFKEVTGESFVAYVARTRIEKAFELLQDPRKRVSEIAFASGFQSLSQFNRVFKKRCGESPRDFRRNGHGSGGNRTGRS